MSGHTDPEIKLDGLKNKPKGSDLDKSAVLGSGSDGVQTQEPQIQWDTFGDKMKLEDYVNFRKSIHPSQVKDMRDNWRGHGTALTKLAAEFSNEVKSVIIDSWDSDGGAAASKAVQDYADQLSQLPTVINAIANSLDASAGFLENTKNNIPDYKGLLANGKDVVTQVWSGTDNYEFSDSETYADDYSSIDPDTNALVKQKLLKMAEDAMNDIYVPGGKAVDKAMPVFPLPKAVADPSKIPGPGPGPATPGPATPGPAVPGPAVPGPASFSPANYSQQQQEYAKQQQEEQERQQREQQQQQQQQQQQEQQQQFQQVAQQGLEQGLQAAQQLGQQFTQQSAQTDAQKLAEGLENPAAAGLATSALNGLGGGSVGGGGGAGGGKVPGLGTRSALASESAAASKLFPRATTTSALGESIEGQPKAGLAGSSGPSMPGMGGMGAAQRGKENEKEKRRAEYLDSEEWLEQAMGDAPVTSKPVVEK